MKLLVGHLLGCPTSNTGMPGFVSHSQLPANIGPWRQFRIQADGFLLPTWETYTEFLALAGIWGVNQKIRAVCGCVGVYVCTHMNMPLYF